MKVSSTFFVAIAGLLIGFGGLYNLESNPQSIVLWVYTFSGFTLFVFADRIVNLVTLRRPMATHVYGVPPKRFRG